ncbi:hypothetical protein F4679DRAFT_457988 [Xylaria curta]|nr:hypothetical protein F4679DRAFT_457988 [Xylaria curta]
MDGNTVCAPCEDSPLSITGNIIGILTFAIALTATFIYRFSLVRKAAAELQLLNRETRVRYKMIKYKVTTTILQTSDPRRSMGFEDIVDVASETMATADELMNLINDLDPAYFDSNKRANLGLGVRYMIMRDRLKVLSERFNTANSLLNDMIDA